MRSMISTVGPYVTCTGKTDIMCTIHHEFVFLLIYKFSHRYIINHHPFSIIMLPYSSMQYQTYNTVLSVATEVISARVTVRP